MGGERIDGAKRGTKVLAVGVLIGSLLLAAVANAALVFDVESEPGDPVGGGVAQHVVIDDPAVTAYRSGYGSVYGFATVSGEEYWSYEFMAPHAEDVMPGLYFDAVAAPFHSPVHAAMRIGHFPGGSFCNVLVGQFAVFEIHYAEDGIVDRLAADFEMRCDQAEGGLRGSVRLNSDVPTRAPTPTAVPATPIPPRLSPYVVLRGTAGESFIGDVAHALSPITGDFTLTRVLGGLVIDFDGGSDDSWTIGLFAPGGEELTAGIYEEARPGPSPRRPGLYLVGLHKFCDTAHGRIVVSEAEYNEDGSVRRFAADFEYHCESSPPILYGHVRIDSDLPIPPPPAATPTPNPAENFLRIGIGGEERTIRSDNGSLTARVYLWPPSGVPFISVGATGDDGYGQSVTMSPPNCDPLVERHYDHTARWGFAVGDEAGLTTGHCNRSTGSYTLDRFRSGTFGEVYELDATFEEYCDGAVVPITGRVRYHSTLPTPTPGRPSPTPSDLSSMAVINSDPGDFIGLCRDRVLTLADGDFEIGNDSGLVEIGYVGTEQGVWLFRFFAPGYQLAPGTYVVWHEFLSVTDEEPTMSITADTHACGGLTGRFTVQEIEYGEGNAVERFAAEFEQHCGGNDYPGLHGWIRYRSTLEPPTPEPTATGTTVRPSNTPTPTLTQRPSFTATPTATVTPTARFTRPPTATITPAPQSGGGGGCQTGGGDSPASALIALFFLACAAALTRRRHFRASA